MSGRESLVTVRTVVADPCRPQLPHLQRPKFPYIGPCCQGNGRSAVRLDGGLAVAGMRRAMSVSCRTLAQAWERLGQPIRCQSQMGREPRGPQRSCPRATPPTTTQ